MFTSRVLPVILSAMCGIATLSLTPRDSSVPEMLKKDTQLGFVQYQIQDLTRAMRDSQDLSESKVLNKLNELTELVSQVQESKTEDIVALQGAVAELAAEASPSAVENFDTLTATVRELQAELESLKAKGDKVTTTVEGGTTTHEIVSSGVKSGGSTGTIVYKSSGGSTGSGSTGSVNRALNNKIDAAVGRWKNHDGLSGRQHAELVHGINTAGMTEAQVATLRDHDHDTYGAGHNFPVVAYRNTSTCPPGGCPPQQQSYNTNVPISKGGGWYLGKRLSR